MTTSWKEAAESRDAAVQNMRAGNTALAQTHALMAIMHLLSASNEPPRIMTSGLVADFSDGKVSFIPSPPAVPTEPGVYQDREGIPWYRTKVESDKPWMDLTHGHSIDRWFTDEYAAQYAPFTRMEAIA